MASRRFSMLWRKNKGFIKANNAINIPQDMTICDSSINSVTELGPYIKQKVTKENVKTTGTKIAIHTFITNSLRVASSIIFSRSSIVLRA